MSVVLKDLELYDFRNHSYFHLKEPQQLIVIIGKNASGKTNIIEAVQLVSMLESFRNPHWSNLIKEGEDKACVKAVFLQNERTLEIQMDVGEGQRTYILNGKKKKKNDLLGLVPAVIFTPDDLGLIKDPSETRRKLIDDIGQQLSSTYAQVLSEYQKTLKQRNTILKEYYDRDNSLPLLESWNENLIILGAMLFTHRVRLFVRYIDKIASFYRRTTFQEELMGSYIPSFQEDDERLSLDVLVDMGKDEVESRLRETLRMIQDKEIIRGKTLVGPHRDEIIFYINGKEARKFASQGQQRSIALALKLGQLTLIKEISGNQPILLLDDVMSELDGQRKELLIKTLDGQIQTIITTTDLACFSQDLLQHAQIIDLS